MELSSQIKKYRKQLNLSQDELAEKIFVTRQTISNWENDKYYPDIHSLLLLSSLFGITLDQLIKGDLQIMKEKVNQTDIKDFERYSLIFGILLAVFVLSAVPLVYYFDYIGMAVLGCIFAAALYFSIKLERMKKANDIQSYREIIAFCNGEKLDEIQRKVEVGKRPYQKVLLTIGCAAATLAVCAAILFLIDKF